MCVSPATSAVFTSRLNAECRSPVSSGKISNTTIVVATKSEMSFGPEGTARTLLLRNPPKEMKSGAKTGRAYRRKMRRKTIKKYRIRDGQGWSFGPHINGHWEGDEYVLGNYVEYPRSSKNKVFFKRVSNKAVRRSESLPLKGNGYRKVFDYWWTIT